MLDANSTSLDIETQLELSAISTVILQSSSPDCESIEFKLSNGSLDFCNGSFHFFPECSPHAHLTCAVLLVSK